MAVNGTNEQITYAGGAGGNDVILQGTTVAVTIGTTPVVESSTTGLVYTFTRVGDLSASAADQLHRGRQRHQHRRLYRHLLGDDLQLRGRDAHHSGGPLDGHRHARAGRRPDRGRERNGDPHGRSRLRLWRDGLAGDGDNRG